MRPSNILALMRSAVVWDNHGCMPLRPADDSFLPQLQRYRRAGVHAVTLNVGFDVDALLKAGYSEETTRMILGGNHLRVARQVWKPVNRPG